MEAVSVQSRTKGNPPSCLQVILNTISVFLINKKYKGGDDSFHSAFLYIKNLYFRGLKMAVL